ncbi:MAG TPA: acyl-CoA dehydrogenase family protein, partial [Polyangiaceae bacterium]|nr:acyl-CoA dehydrogenase family protein [Polyangiaceae bacterium]
MSARRISLSMPDLGVFFEERHKALAAKLTSGALEPLADLTDASAVAHALAVDLGLSSYLVPESLGGAPVGDPESPTYIDVRSLVLIREALGHVSPLADAIFAVQGLGTYPIVLAGDEDQKARYLPGLLAGERIAAFALTEPEAGSDAGALQAVAERVDSSW